MDLRLLVENPTEFVDSFVATTTDYSQLGLALHNYVSAVLENGETRAEFIARIPSLNLVHPQYIENGSLVRYRCMVQDMYDPEYFPPTSTHVHSKTRDRSVHSNFYRDFHVLHPDCVMEENVATDEMYERSIVRCVNVPGENNWVEEVTQAVSNGQSSATVSTKRTFQEIESAMDESDDSTFDRSKKHFSSAGETPALINSSVKFNGARIVLYTNFPDLKLCNTVEVVGIFYHAVEEEHKNDCDNIAPILPNDASIHALTVRVCKTPYEILPRAELNALQVRDSLLEYLKCCVGSKVASEYLLASLVSKIKSRVGDEVVGKFSLNLYSPTINPSQILLILQSLCPRVVHLKMTITNLNSFLSTKTDFGYMYQGILALSSDTVLCIDETELDVGVLTPVATKNLQVLSSLIRNQTIPFSFNEFAPLTELPCDVRVIIISKTKSILPPDSRVRLQFDEAIPNTFLPTSTQLEVWRDYIYYASQLESNIPDQVASFIQEYFVNMRKVVDFKPEMLHYLLTLSRNLSHSFMEKDLTIERFEYCRSLDDARSKAVNIAQNA